MTRRRIWTVPILAGLWTLLLFALLAAWLLVHEREARAWVRHTAEVREALADYRIVALRSEVAARGYLIDGDLRNLGVHAALEREAPIKLEIVRRLTADNPRQQHRFAELRAAFAQHRKSVEAMITARGRGDTQAIAPLLLESANQAATRRIYALSDSILREEIALDAQRRTRAAHIEQATVAVLSAMALVFIGLTILGVRDRRDKMKALEEANDRLIADNARQRAIERELALLAENATDAVFRLGPDGRYLYASPSAADILGQRPENLLGQSILAGLHPDDQVDVFTALHQLRTGLVERVTLTYRMARAGGWVWLEASGGLIRDTHGALLEIITSVRDVSARKALELELREARLAAEAAGTAKSTFLANMSHEIRTPMNGVMGFADLLLATRLDADQRRYVELIAESGGAMIRLLNDILDLSKVEAGQMRLVREPLDLHQSLQSCAKLVAPATLQKQVLLHCDIAPDVPKMVLGDDLRLRQILLNLLGNAAKFTRAGTVSLRARWIPDGETSAIVLEVEDSGIGISPERQAAIFDPFVQAEDSTSAAFGGTGLGLPITAQLVRLMGGTIALTSVQGRGTLVTVTLPLPSAEAPQQVEETIVASTAGTDLGCHVLVAEDHDVNQLLIRSTLEQLGCRVDMANDGAEAVEMVVAAREAGDLHRLVFMDVRMPVMDGLAATRRIRELGIGSDLLPIIALTANAYRDDVEACLKAGMQAHMAKPFKLDDIKEALGRWTAGTALVPSMPAEGALAPRPSVAERYRARKDDVFARVEALSGMGIVDDAAMADLCELLHKLAGTAGMFGDAELGEQARALEDSLPACAAADRQSTLAEALRMLREAA